MSEHPLGIGFGGGEPQELPEQSPALLPQEAAAALDMKLAALEVVTGRQPGVRFPLNQVKLLLGRHDPPKLTVDLDLTDQELGAIPMVSRRHAELSWEQGRLLLRDLGSTNGTFVNGEQLPSPGRGQPGEPRELRAGDLVRVANLELKVVSP